MTRQLVVELEGGKVRTSYDVPGVEILVFDWDRLSSDDATEEELVEACTRAQHLLPDHPERQRIYTALVVLLARLRARPSET